MFNSATNTNTYPTEADPLALRKVQASRLRRSGVLRTIAQHFSVFFLFFRSGVETNLVGSSLRLPHALVAPCLELLLM